MCETIVCELCGGLPKSKSAYEKHIHTKKHLIKSGQLITQNNEHRCETCNKSYCSHQALVAHQQTEKHKRGGLKPKKVRHLTAGRPKGMVLEKTIKCDQCDQMFSSEYHLRRHLETH